MRLVVAWPFGFGRVLCNFPAVLLGLDPILFLEAFLFFILRLLLGVALLGQSHVFESTV